MDDFRGTPMTYKTPPYDRDISHNKHIIHMLTIVNSGLTMVNYG